MMLVRPALSYCAVRGHKYVASLPAGKAIKLPNARAAYPLTFTFVKVSFVHKSDHKTAASGINSTRIRHVESISGSLGATSQVPWSSVALWSTVFCLSLCGAFVSLRLM